MGLGIWINYVVGDVKIPHSMCVLGIPGRRFSFTV
jgi:hypothetical protein